MNKTKSFSPIEPFPLVSINLNMALKLFFKEVKFCLSLFRANSPIKISLNKYWGGAPNTIGNYCIVGHNYKNKNR